MKDRIDALILERAPWMAGQGLPTRLARGAMHLALGYDACVALAESMESLPTQRIMDRMAGRIAHRVHAAGLEHIPRTGPALIVANHPTGIADGVILHALLSRRRPDLYFFANSDIIRLLPQMAEMIVPVEWREDRRSRAHARETMLAARAAVEAGRLGIIFPSGRLMKRRGLTLHERPWMASAASLARRFDLPVIPLHVRARNSALFYAFDRIHPTLRDVTLFHETLNKSRQRFAIQAGPAIMPADLPARPEDAIEFLRAATLALGGRMAAPALPRRAGVRPQQAPAIRAAGKGSARA